jgi:hypothetical protein
MAINSYDQQARQINRICKKGFDSNSQHAPFHPEAIQHPFTETNVYKKH